MRQKYIKWTQKNIKKLQNLAKENKSIEEIAIIFKTTKNSIQGSCVRFNIKTRLSPKEWSNNEIKKLKKYLKQRISLPEICKKLNRSRTSIDDKIKELELINNVFLVKKWTITEIQKLKNLLNKKKNYLQISKILKRTPLSIKVKISNLGLTYTNIKRRPKKNKTYKNISGNFFSKIIHGAEMRNIDFNLNIDYVWNLFDKQKGKCAISGVDINFKNKQQNIFENTASLDRINSSKGYIKGNVQWVHKKINIIKWNLPEKEFLNWIKKIYEFKKLSKFWFH